MFEIYASQVCV